MSKELLNKNLVNRNKTTIFAQYLLTEITVMIRYLTLLTFLLVFDLSCHAEASEVLQRLDDALSSASKFDAEKKSQIKHLHDIASSARSENDRYKACIELYEAYESYKYDSASV